MIRTGSLLLVASLIFAFMACEKKKEDCAFLAPAIVYIGFSESESDTLIIRRYSPNNQFDKLLDTFMVTKANINRVPVGADSVRLDPINYTRFNEEFHANNWEIYLPGADQTVRIDQIMPRFMHKSETGSTCQSYASNARVNLLPYAWDSWFGTGYRVYVKNEE